MFIDDQAEEDIGQGEDSLAGRLQQALRQGVARGIPLSGIHGRLVHSLGAAIVGGRIGPGERIDPDDILFQDLNPSRTAVREAFKVLETKGLIDARQRKGTTVRQRQDWDILDTDVLAWHAGTDISEEFARDLVELRELIEPIAARLAASRAGDDDFTRMDEAFRAMSRGVDEQDTEIFYQGDLAFHLAVLAACHNQLLRRLDGIIGTVLGLSFDLQKEGLDQPRESLDDHYLIVEKIRNRDRRGAEQSMRKVIRRAREEISRQPNRNFQLK